MTDVIAVSVIVPSAVYVIKRPFVLETLHLMDNSIWVFGHLICHMQQTWIWHIQFGWIIPDASATFDPQAT